MLCSHDSLLCCCWSLLYSAILRSRAISLPLAKCYALYVIFQHLHVMRVPHLYVMFPRPWLYVMLPPLLCFHGPLLCSLCYIPTSPCYGPTAAFPHLYVMFPHLLCSHSPVLCPVAPCPHSSMWPQLNVMFPQLCFHSLYVSTTAQTRSSGFPQSFSPVALCWVPTQLSRPTVLYSHQRPPTIKDQTSTGTS